MRDVCKFVDKRGQTKSLQKREGRRRRGNRLALNFKSNFLSAVFKMSPRWQMRWIFFLFQKMLLPFFLFFKKHLKEFEEFGLPGLLMRLILSKSFFKNLHKSLSQYSLLINTFTFYRMTTHFVLKSLFKFHTSQYAQLIQSNTI